jgi:hypothetical protein
LSIIQKLEQKAPAMRIVRLPGIHHDSNVVVVIGSAGNLLIDAGTSWYQSLQVERITGVLDGGSLDRILLTCRRFPCSGGAKHISEMFSNCPIHIHEEGQASLSSGDFFTTWSNRFDSDMPFTTSLIVEDGELFILGDCQVSTIPLPGHTGCLPDIVSSLKLIKTMNLESLIPLQGPAIKGKKHITEVLEKHINFFIKCIEAEGIAPKSWSRPAQTAIWHTPHPPWPLEEREDA